MLIKMQLVISKFDVSIQECKTGRRVLTFDLGEEDDPIEEIRDTIRKTCAALGVAKVINWNCGLSNPETTVEDYLQNVLK